MTIAHRSYEEFRRLLAAELTSARIPFSGTVELTTACTFACPHCYVGGRRTTGADRSFFHALWRQLAQAGCVGITLTGGEPLLHPEFSAIYEDAYDLGFRITVFTNADLVDTSVCALFARKPPRVVEVTLYGASNAAYLRVTGEDGAWDRVRRGLSALRAADVRLFLKAVLLEPLLAEMEAMTAFARSLGLHLAVDAAVTPTVDGDTAPLAWRCAPEDAVRWELAHPRRKEAMGRQAAAPHPQSCGAGSAGFHVTADGALTPCVMMPRPAVDLHHTAFAAAWEQLGAAMEPPALPAACAACPDSGTCPLCPATLAIESPEHRAYYCQVAHQRKRALQ